ncbi:MAG: hypothetical protein HY790_14920 [Deltaproteobacteria bacterium]|nr:hypothetical protein [Deltaproteobacteria bacterium]
MSLRPASPRIFRCPSLLLILVWFGVAGVNAAQGRDGEPVSPKPGPVLEVKIQEEVEKPVAAAAAAAAPSLALDPFFLIEEEASRVRVRRVQVALEFLQPEMLKGFDPQAPRLRELVYDFLVTKEEAHPTRETKEQEKLLAGLVNRWLGQEAVSAVKLDYSLLLR